MIRSLKTLLLTVALTAPWALGVVSSHAAEFHCAVEPCQVTVQPDGIGETAHQEFALAQGGNFLLFTCNTMSGEGKIGPKAKTTEELVVHNIEYQTCAGGGFAGIKMNGCDYRFFAAGEMSIECPGEQKIEWEVLECTTTIGSQGPLKGIKYHNLGKTKKERITVEMQVEGIKGIVEKKGCLLDPGEFTGEIRTSNIILTGETSPEGGEPVIANVWWE